MLFFIVGAFVLFVIIVFIVLVSMPSREEIEEIKQRHEYLNQNQRALARAREYEKEMAKQRSAQPNVVEESKPQTKRRRKKEFTPTQSKKPSLQELLEQGLKNHSLDTKSQKTTHRSGNYQPPFDGLLKRGWEDGSSKSSNHEMNDFSYHVATDYYVTWRDEYEFNVVGTSHYQHILERFADPRTENSQEKRVIAFIQHEPTNPYDKNACAVYIQYECVGYLPREDASKFVSTLKRLKIATNSTVAVKAIIVGGWSRPNGDIGHFGLYLDLPETVSRISKSISNISFEDSYRKLKTKKS